MNCPLCAKPTVVLSTRTGLRRRECFNGHRFTTVETVLPTTPRRKKPARLNAMEVAA